MTLIERINALATVVAGHIKTRSIPPGGAVGNVLVKNGPGDYATAWQSQTGASQSDLQRIEAQNWFL
ncbi:MAG: hypothetical protein LCH91_14200 [Bacteroidetes bacterium]|nr:hypothetical protein [Bacteroidota bacterium]